MSFEPFSTDQAPMFSGMESEGDGAPSPAPVKSARTDLLHQCRHSAASTSRAFPERCSHGFVAWAILFAVLTSAIWENAWGKLPTKR